MFIKLTDMTKQDYEDIISQVPCIGTEDALMVCEDAFVDSGLLNAKFTCTITFVD